MLGCVGFVQSRTLGTPREGVWFMHGIQGELDKFDEVEYSILCICSFFFREGTQSFLSAFQNDS